MSGPNKQKIIEDYGRSISWYQEGESPREVNLIKMINARASLSVGEKIDLFEYYNFPEKINGKDVRKFLLENTRHIPRDMIRLMKQIQLQSDSDNMTKNRLISAANNYSKYYFKGELKDELDGFANKEDVMNFFSILPNVPSYILSSDQIKSTADEMGLKINLSHLLPILFNLGAIGMVRQDKNGNRVFFKYRDDYIEYNSLNKIILHTALQNIARAQGGPREQESIESDLD